MITPEQRHQKFSRILEIDFLELYKIMNPTKEEMWEHFIKLGLNPGSADKNIYQFLFKQFPLPAAVKVEIDTVDARKINVELEVPKPIDHIDLDFKF